MGRQQRVVAGHRRQIDRDDGQRRGGGGEADAQRRQFRHAAAVELLGQGSGEIGFATALMGECQQLHHDAAGDARAARLDQALPGGAGCG